MAKARVDAEVFRIKHSQHAPEVRAHEAPMVDHDAVAPEVYYNREAPEHYNTNVQYGQAYAREQEYAAGREQDSRNRKRICGLRPVTFWLALALLVVVIGAAVGGGVGGSLAGKSGTSDSAAAEAQRTSTTSTTPTSTDPTTSSASASITPSASPANDISSVPGPYVTTGRTGITALNCTDSKLYTTSSGVQFEEHCQTNWYSGMEGAEGKVRDIDNVITYTFEACMDSCDEWNARGDDPGCQSVVYDQNLTSSVPHNGGNCVLKTTNGVTDPRYDGIAGAVRLQ